MSVYLVIIGTSTTHVTIAEFWEKHIKSGYAFFEGEEEEQEKDEPLELEYVKPRGDNFEFEKPVLFEEEEGEIQKMNKNEQLLITLLERIKMHGYVHNIDRALVDLWTTNATVKEISERYSVSTNAIYRHKSRIVLLGGIEV